MAEQNPALENAAHVFNDLKNALAKTKQLEADLDATEKEAATRITELTHQVAQQDQRYHAVERENEQMRKLVKRANGERDHWMRSHSALKAYLLTLMPSIKHAVEMAERHAMGEKAPEPEDATEQLPDKLSAVVRLGPAALTDEQRNRTMTVLERALMGPIN